MILRVALVFSLVFSLLSSMTVAHDKVVLTLQVTERGLLLHGQPVRAKQLHIRRGQRVQLVLQYADANRNAHQFGLVSLNTELKSQRIAPDGAKTATLSFRAAANAAKRSTAYRVSCPAIAMEELTDYIIYVDGA